MKTGIGSRLKPRLFYGWWMVMAAFAIVALGEGAFGYMVRELPLFVRDELGGSFGQVGLVLQLSHLAGLLALLAIAPLIDRFGPRWPMVAGVALVGIGFLALSTLPGPLVFFAILAVLVGVGRSAGFSLPAQAAAANWFVRRRSLALAVVSAASVGGAGLTLIAGQFPWRGTSLAVGGVLLVIGVPLALLMRQRPERYGQMPDGRAVYDETSGGLQDSPRATASEVTFTLGQTLRTRAFWLLAGAMALGQASASVAFLYQFPLLRERGLPPGTFGIASDFVPLIGILLFGFLGDRFSKRHLLALAAVLQSVSPAVLTVPGLIAPVLLYPLVSGLGSGTVPLLLAIRADYFGRRAFATITVATMLATVPLGFAAASLPLLAGWLQDVTGSFVPGMALSMLIGLAAAVVFLLAREPNSPQPSPSGLNR